MPSAVSQVFGGRAQILGAQLPPPAVVSAAVVRSALACAATTVLLGGAIAQATQTPGRVVVPLAADGSAGPVCAAELADGRVLIAARAGDGSMRFLRLAPGGREDWSVPLPSLAGDEPIGVIALGDETAYVLAKPAQEAADEPVAIAHVLADGTLDPAFGQAGVAQTSATARGLLYRGGWCRPPAAAQPDGRLILGSADGRVERLLTDGREDAGFTAPAGAARTAVSVLADGRIAVNEGEDGLLVLGPNGSPDPGFNDGRPLDTGGSVFALVPRADGSVDVFGRTAERIGPAGSVLVRAPSGGNIPLPLPDGGELAVAALTRSGIDLDRFDASLARVHGVAYRDPRFGGLPAVVAPVKHVEWAATEGFGSTAFLPHGDGLLVVGLVTLPNARGTQSHDEIGVAALHADGAPDGGPAARAA